MTIEEYNLLKQIEQAEKEENAPKARGLRDRYRRIFKKEPQ